MSLLRLSSPRAHHPRAWSAAVLVLALSSAAVAAAAPTVGFIENWSGVSLSGWTGGSTYSNPGTGGFGGAGDGFLRVTNTIVKQLGTYSSGTEYMGNWQAAGVTHVIVFLNNLSTTNPLEIHFGIGRDVHNLSPNFWLYTKGFIPPVGSWGEFDVDLTAAANFIQIFGAGTLADALQNTEKLHFRHDLAPYSSSPDLTIGDFGIDRLVLSNVPAGVEPVSRVSVGRAVQLAPPAPNPSRGGVLLSLEVFEPGPVHVQIVDALGRVVRSAELAAGAAGSLRWSWDGADDRGRLAPPGSYRARAWGASGGTSRPLVRIR